MIQRVQTIFLALIILLFAMLFFLPVYKLTITIDGIPMISFRSLGRLSLLLAGTGLVALLAMVAIFQYKNRKKQLLIVNIGMILSLLVFTLCIAFPDVFSDAVAITNHPPVTGYSIGTFLIALFPALFFFAGRKIKKDEKLVKDADRLR